MASCYQILQFVLIYELALGVLGAANVAPTILLSVIGRALFGWAYVILIPVISKEIHGVDENEMESTPGFSWAGFDGDQGDDGDGKHSIAPSSRAACQLGARLPTAFSLSGLR